MNSRKKKSIHQLADGILQFEDKRKSIPQADFTDLQTFLSAYLNTPEPKKRKKLAEEFRKENGSIICRDLLSGITSDTAPVPEARTDDYYKKRPCKDLAVCAAEILERKLEERKAQDLEKNGQK